MLAAISSRFGRAALGVIALLIIGKLLLVWRDGSFPSPDTLSMPWGSSSFYNGADSKGISCDASTLPSHSSNGAEIGESKAASVKTGGRTPVSYDKTTPPSIGCEDKVIKLQQRVIEAYSKLFKGISHAHIFGYLGGTENKGDAAIWVAQDILLATLGIKTMRSCRYVEREKCSIDEWTQELEDHKPNSAIIMAGGGNFNDYFRKFWDDHPARLRMAEKFGDYPIRAFPQSINMTNATMIEQTARVFGAGKDVQLAARDRPSFDFLQQTFGDEATIATPNKVKHVLTPDIAFMFGSRPDLRLNTKKTHQIYILARGDSESSAADAKAIAAGEGVLDLGGTVGNVTYLKNDWQNVWTKHVSDDHSLRNWKKAMHGFEILASADFVITDRLHGHIMSTIMGIPHVLLDSRLKKNLFLHDTWTKDCDCTRIADTFSEALNFAKMYFEKQSAAKDRT